MAIIAAGEITEADMSTWLRQRIAFD